MNMLAPTHELIAGASSAPPAETVYLAIQAESTPRGRAEPFTAHVLACTLTMAIVEAYETGGTLSTGLGLNRTEIESLTAQWAPAARRFFDLAAEPEHVLLDEEETQLHQLLTRFASDSAPLTGWIASIVTRRAMAPRHLWQDLGLLERAELTRLMKDWFPTLAEANVANMKWKKFFYRQLCELEGFSLCAAPTCRDCDDFDNCFGAEDGASALARLSHR
jgi:nitrogen fixation protein NifQ